VELWIGGRMLEIQMSRIGATSEVHISLGSVKGFCLASLVALETSNSFSKFKLY